MCARDTHVLLSPLAPWLSGSYRAPAGQARAHRHGRAAGVPWLRLADPGPAPRRAPRRRAGRTRGAVHCAREPCLLNIGCEAWRTPGARISFVAPTRDPPPGGGPSQISPIFGYRCQNGRGRRGRRRHSATIRAARSSVRHPVQVYIIFRSLVGQLAPFGPPERPSPFTLESKG